MGVNSASSGGEAQIDLFEITSNYSGETVDIRQGISVVYVYESLFDSTVRVNVQYVDTGNGLGKAITESDFNNSVGEKTELVIRQFFKNKFQKKIQTINFTILHSLISKYNIDSKNIKESELFEKKILNKSKGSLKLLNYGELKDAINIEISSASKKAIEKIEKFGGKIITAKE